MKNLSSKNALWKNVKWWWAGTEKEKTEIHGSSNSHKKAAPGRSSWFDPGVKAITLLCIF